MSILNAWVRPDVGLVATDSQFERLPGEEVAYPQTSKFYVLPHYPAILAARGLANSLAAVAVQVNLLGLNFDDALKQIPDLIAAFDSLTVSKAPEILHISKARLELLAIGWSPLDHRIIGREFIQAKAGERVQVDEIDPEFSAPWREGFHGPKGDGIESIVALTRAQHRELSGPLGGSGGEIIVATVTRDVVSCKKMGPLDAA